MCNVRTTTVITFIFRINTLSFPLCRHISPGGGGLLFCLPETQAVKISPLLHPWLCPNPVPWNNSPARAWLRFLSPQPEEGRPAVLRAERPSAARYEEEDEESRSPPSRHRRGSFASRRLRVCGHLKAFFPRLPVFASSASDRRALIFPHGARVRHKSFS